MENKLKDSLCYLCGPISFAKDHGIGWRDSVIKLSEKLNLDIKFLNPCTKFGNFTKESAEEKDKISQLKKGGNWEDITKLMKKIVRYDLRFLDLSDFIIAYIDTKVHMCGSYQELLTALIQKKPYFIIVDGGKKNTPDWLFGILDHNNIYSSVEDVVLELSRLNSGYHEMNDRWVLFRQEIKNL